MIKTIEELKNECVNLFGLEHANTKSFFNDCEIFSSIKYLNEILEEMKMYNKINNCEIAHAIVQLPDGRIVVVELVNKHYDFYATAFVAIKQAIDNKYSEFKFIDVLDIITE